MKCVQGKHMQGLTLIEILLAMVIFATGMLALAHLQSNLTRSSIDANTRTVAANIGEEIMETLRAFQRVSSDPDNLVFAYADIDQAFVEQTVSRGGLDYTVTGTVEGYDFQADNVNLGAPVTAVKGALYDFKLIELTIAWDNNQQFQIDEAQQISNADIGTGSITIKELIPSIPALTAAKVAAADNDALGGPPVDYTPGLNPDIVAINLDNFKFKESTTPIPDVIRRDEFVETWFDVITYSQTAPDAVFLRREEFLTVSCECTLRASGGGNTGFLPTVWNGVSFTEGEFVSKPFGESASNQQSNFCDTCCRDHHDGAAGKSSDDQVYDPQRTWTGPSDTSVDHEHYSRSKKGVLMLATDGDSYVEVCRMIRKDGFMRVAQDFRQEGFSSFPKEYLDDTAEVAEYSTYVTDAVGDFYNSNNPSPTLADFTVAYPGSAETLPTLLPTSGPTANFQQLRSRGIYVDHVSVEAKLIIDCMIGPPALTGDDCGAPGAQDFLEVLPFFEVQLTFLAWWNEDTEADPVEVSNEALESGNTHSRGLAKKTSDTPEVVKVNTNMHRGNIGFSVTDPIDDPLGTSKAVATGTADLYVEVGDGGGTPTPSGLVVDGIFISGVNGVNASSATITPATGTTCTRSGTALSCTTVSTNAIGSITISGYSKNATTDLWVCPSSFTYTAISWVYTGTPKSTTITWANTAQSGIVLSIESSSCN